MKMFCGGLSTLPEGFDPHTELTRIFNLRDMMQGCRERTPKVFQVLDDALEDENIGVRLQAAAMCLDRGYGKPMRQVQVTVDTGVTTARRVLEIPSNNRDRQSIGKTIDVETP